MNNENMENPSRFKGYQGFKIGSILIDPPVVLAPMAGVTDLPFRLLCREMGCAFTCSEMISAKAITYKNKKTFTLMETAESDHPLALQLFGSEPEVMAEAVRMIDDVPAEIIDINMGCPVPKVVSNGEGSALMTDPVLAGKIIEAVVKAGRRPVTVKIRKGFDDEHVNAPEIARIAQESGAAAVTVHGRTRQQYYSGKADWDVIRQVKDSVGIPVIGNGDIFSGNDALRMMKETGCDGVMVGRGARGNPWIFREICSAFRDGRSSADSDLIPETFIPTEEDLKTESRKRKLPVPPDELVDMILRHTCMSIGMKGEYLGIREMRKHVGWYTAGYPDSARIRFEANKVEKYEQMRELLLDWAGMVKYL